MERSSYARVCVRMDLSKSLKLGIWLNGEFGRTYQAFEYKGLSQICFSYGHVGHHAGQCNTHKSMEAVHACPASSATPEDNVVRGGLMEVEVTHNGDGKTTEAECARSPRKREENVYAPEEKAQKLGPWMLVQPRLRRQGAADHSSIAGKVSQNPRKTVSRRTHDKGAACMYHGMRSPSMDHGRGMKRQASNPRACEDWVRIKQADASMKDVGTEQAMQVGGNKGKYLLL
ncbi:hypothetical protein HPP92_004457 [Vanilla planifolia]|uniref:DUF4283 domain-containing protein n=1 Tax=Vanilla planifolia TaxID=51239 RepID=A0A835VDM7_VANPL|nr:hypothetical protein HPP92_004457 [Vanilla planifolia]